MPVGIGNGSTMSIIKASFLEGTACRNFFFAIAHDFIKGILRSKDRETSRLISIIFLLAAGLSKFGESFCLRCSGSASGSNGFTHLGSSCIWRIVILRVVRWSGIPRGQGGEFFVVKCWGGDLSSEAAN